MNSQCQCSKGGKEENKLQMEAAFTELFCSPLASPTSPFWNAHVVFFQGNLREMPIRIIQCSATVKNCFGDTPLKTEIKY